MSSRIPAVAGALLIALVVPASADAATIEPLKPCYVGVQTQTGQLTEGITIHGAGFAPGSKVDLTIDGQLAGDDLQTDPAGALNLLPENVPAPFVPSGERDFTVTLTEVGNEANTVSATAKATALGVSVKPRRAKPSKRVRFTGSGFTGPKPVYAHYVYKNKVRKTVRMARKLGTCGSWNARRPQIPVDDPKTGLWTVQFDQSKRYFDATKPNSGLEGVFVRLPITVTFVPRRRG